MLPVVNCYVFGGNLVKKWFLSEIKRVVAG
jgi:hypothetical protein